MIQPIKVEKRATNRALVAKETPRTTTAVVRGEFVTIKLPGDQ
jgi:hypothetical protein